MARIFLELFIDEYPIYEKGSITEFFAVGSINNMDNCMKSYNLIDYFFFRVIISIEIPQFIFVFA